MQDLTLLSLCLWSFQSQALTTSMAKFKWEIFMKINIERQIIAWHKAQLTKNWLNKQIKRNWQNA